MSMIATAKKPAGATTSPAAAAKAASNGNGQLDPNRFKGAVQQAVAAEKAKYAEIPIIRSKAFKSDFWDGVLANADQLDPNAPPPELEYCSILGRGPKGSGKSSMAAGNQRCIILSPPDGRTVYPCCRATILRVDHYAYDHNLDNPKDRSWEGNIKRMLEAAYKVGPNGDFCMFWLDSVYEIVQWLMQRELEKKNADIDSRNAWGQSDRGKGANWIPINHLNSIREDDDANGSIFPMLGEELAAIARDFKGAGWGFGSSVHLQLGYDWGEKSVKDKPDIPGSLARALDKPADLVLDCKRASTNKDDPLSFVVSPSSSRVPMQDFSIPNWADLPEGLTWWDIIRHEYEKGRKEWQARQQAFQKSDNNPVIVPGAAK